MKKLKVCIPTAGMGSRVNEFSSGLNKSLIDINYKPVISHIINLFPKETSFVIPIGYKGNLLKDYLKIAHPHKKITFVKIKNYQGKGSGLGLTLLKSKKFLNEPFIFVSCDTLVKNKIINANHNWVGYSYQYKKNSYRGFEISKNGFVKKFLDKEQKTKNKAYNYIGLAGVYDYKNFWKKMEKYKNKSIPSGEFFGIKDLKNIKAYKFEWFDTGNSSSLKKTKIHFEKIGFKRNILPKLEEKIWFDEKLVIKYFKDENIVKKRVKRSSYLKGYVPKIIKFSKNFYAYKEVEGEIMSKIKSEKIFHLFLKKLYKFHELKPKLSNKRKKNFIEKCNNFYRVKTLKRIKDFEKKFQIKDNINSINNKKMNKLSFLINKIDWKNICDPKISRFHGDLHFENIIYQKKNKDFVFLDWRHDFGGSIKYGDLYYDLAKIQHGLIVSHDKVSKQKFYVNQKNDNVSIGISKPNIYKIYLKLFKTWLVKNNYDVNKVDIMTALIFLNIASLHHYPYSKYLYYLGKEILSEKLN